jgi:hypothetical protein
VDGSGSVYVSGFFTRTFDFDPGAGTDYHTSTDDSEDAFLSRFDSSGNFVWTRTWGGAGSDQGFGVAVDGLGNVVVTGDFQDTVDFEPGPGVDNHTFHGTWDVFLIKFLPDGYW